MNSSSTHSPAQTHEGGATLSGYLTGFLLALVLTLIPFGLVAFGGLSTGTTLIVVAVSAVAQILVHLRFFLHLDMSDQHRWSTVSAAFSAVILFILVAGTVWLFYNLHYRMMVGH